MAKKKIYRYPLYLMTRGLAGLISFLPRPVLLMLARIGGRLAYWIVVRQRRKALENLRLAFTGEKSESEIRVLAGRVFENVSQTGAELLKFPSLNAARIAQIVDYGETEAVYRRLLSEGNGLVSLTAHIGNWELLAAAVIARGFKVCVVGRRLYYEPYNQWILSLRRSIGAETVYRDSSARELIRTLRKNQIVGILPDQDIDSLKGIFVDYFGRPAYTPVSPAKLSLSTGAPILPNFLIREGNTRYRIVLGEVIRPLKNIPKEKALEEMTRAWMSACERVIKQYPDQWAWMHNRWKTRPKESEGSAGGGNRPEESLYFCRSI